MTKLTAIVLLMMIITNLTAQKPVVNPYGATDKKMLQIPAAQTQNTEAIAGYVRSNFSSDKEKARAIFIWTASSISYDIDNMFAINFYEKKEDKIAKALATRKGICENYAAVFQDICTKAGIRSYVIEGYTKQNGFTDYIPHAWCAAFIDSAWRMFDPTWGSGYVQNGRFFKKINNAYCMAEPALLIKSHMPFDYLWQFLSYPVTNQAFYEGKTQPNKTNLPFKFADSIRAYEQQDSIHQLEATARRVEKNGVKNAMIFDRLHHIIARLENIRSQQHMDAENERQRKTTSLYNSSVLAYNQAVNAYNEFIAYRNKQFMPEQPDSSIIAMIGTSAAKLQQAKQLLEEIENPDASLAALIAQQQNAISTVGPRIKEQQDWLAIFFSKPKNKRKSMFYEKKTSWFGIPLN